MSILENLKKKALESFQAEKARLVDEIQEKAEEADDEAQLMTLARLAYTHSVKKAMSEKFDAEASIEDVKVLMSLSGAKSSADLMKFIDGWTRHDFLKVVAALQYLRGASVRPSVAPAVILPFIKSQFQDGAKQIDRTAFIRAIGAHYRAKGKPAPSDLVNPFMSFLTLLHGGSKGIGLLEAHYTGRSIDHWTFGPKASKYLSA